MTSNNGGPAFPLAATMPTVSNNGMQTVHTPFIPANHGMTLRDYFAAKAMQAYVFPEMLHGANTEDEIAMEFQNVAAFAYRVADAMLKERAK